MCFIHQSRAVLVVFLRDSSDSARIVFRSRNAKIGGLSSGFTVLLDKGLKMPVPEVKAGIFTQSKIDLKTY